MGRKDGAFLRKTCISNMPVEDIKEYGDRFIITISDSPDELMMMDMKRLADYMESLDQHDEAKRKILIQILCIRSEEYDITETGSTAYIGREYVSVLGKPGEKVKISYEKGGVWKIKSVGL